jgi:hypothetical protein
MCSSYASLDRQRRAKRPPLTPVCHNLRPLARGALERANLYEGGAVRRLWALKLSSCCVFVTGWEVPMA